VGSDEDDEVNDTAPAIVVRELRHSYGSFVALDGIDLEVATGEDAPAPGQ
jgi:ABC-type transporter Mla maintaining outer membrane lipid asymmetry ATPase subunit MlaF